jgi:nucleoside-diphosphate-sugar epimerase
VTTDAVAGEVFQLGTSVETSILKVAEIVLEAVGTDVAIHFEPRPAGEVYKSRVDFSKATRPLNFNPTIASSTAGPVCPSGTGGSEPPSRGVSEAV